MSQENTTILLDAAFLTSSQYLSEIDLWPFFSTARDRGKIIQFCSSYNFVGQMSDQKLDIPLNAYIKTSLRGGRCDRRSNLYHETEIATVEATSQRQFTICDSWWTLSQWLSLSGRSDSSRRSASDLTGHSRSYWKHWIPRSSRGMTEYLSPTGNLSILLLLPVRRSVSERHPPKRR